MSCIVLAVWPWSSAATYEPIIMTWVGWPPHAALKYVRQTCSISEVVSISGRETRGCCVSTLGVQLVLVSLRCDVVLVLVLHLAAGLRKSSGGQRRACSRKRCG